MTNARSSPEACSLACRRTPQCSWFNWEGCEQVGVGPGLCLLAAPRPPPEGTYGLIIRVLCVCRGTVPTIRDASCWGANARYHLA